MSKAAKRRTQYRFHRAALAPLLPGATPVVLKQACEDAIELGETAFSDFLHSQGLAPLWDEVLALQCSAASPLSEGFKESLHQARRHATGLYLAQHHRLKQIRGILDDEGIAHVVYKGADTRERYFVVPALRPATDIDLLVDDRSKIRAIQALQRDRFRISCNRGQHQPRGQSEPGQNLDRPALGYYAAGENAHINGGGIAGR